MRVSDRSITNYLVDTCKQKSNRSSHTHSEQNRSHRKTKNNTYISRFVVGHDGLMNTGMLSGSDNAYEETDVKNGNCGQEQFETLHEVAEPLILNKPKAR